MDTVIKMKHGILSSGSNQGLESMPPAAPPRFSYIFVIIVMSVFLHMIY